MIYVLIIVFIVASETLIKNYVEKNMHFSDKKEILKGNIILKKRYNCGIIFNYLENKKELVKCVSCFILGSLLLLFTFLLPKKGNRIFKLGLSLMLGGAISNVMDRIIRGYVVDYFSFKFKPIQKIVFNLADIFIFLGGILVTISSLFFAEGKSCSNEPFE